jgi:hypothetical protein
MGSYRKGFVNKISGCEGGGREDVVSDGQWALERIVIQR